MAVNYRSPVSITYSTWKALFLREAVGRLFTERAAWLWILLEPLLHIVILLLIYSTMRVRTLGGIDTLTWLALGMLSFFMFRRVAIQAMNAISANEALFTYRQVKPVDTVLVRTCLEGLLMLWVMATLIAGALLFDRFVFPSDPFAVIAAILGLWLLGTGLGLTASAAKKLIPELGRIINISMMPLYFISGVLFPISAVPQPYRGWLMLNPIAHGLEATRLGFSPYYHAAPELNIQYVYGYALVLIFVGLALHVRYANRMTMA